MCERAKRRRLPNAKEKMSICHKMDYIHHYIEIVFICNLIDNFSIKINAILFGICIFAVERGECDLQCIAFKLLYMNEIFNILKYRNWKYESPANVSINFEYNFDTNMEYCIKWHQFLYI